MDLIFRKPTKIVLLEVQYHILKVNNQLLGILTDFP